MLFSKAKWIWINDSPKPDEYAVFEEEFEFSGDKTVFTVSAETDYVLYVNGVLAGFAQFPNYPDTKYFDELDITPLCKKTKNRFTLTGRHEGARSLTHIQSGAGVIFSLDTDKKNLTYSSAQTKGGYDNRYVQHEARPITMQIGFASHMRVGSYCCDMNCVEVAHSYNLVPRPVLKTEAQTKVNAVLIDREKHLYDLGRETAGYLFVKIRSLRPSTVTVAYGQHIADGAVRQKIGGRDFSLSFDTAEGDCEFTQYFIRISGRYLQAFLPEGCEIIELGILPYLYPVNEKPFELKNELDQKIYDTCVRTMRLCMNHHYEDTPWREQALFLLDARNQMLCGYYAFGEERFARANLEFVAKSLREDGFLELTCPSVGAAPIPFFSAMYPVAVYEYIEHTGDRDVLTATMPAMLKIMESLRARVEENGLIRSLPAPFWNFFEWGEGSAGKIPGSPNYVYEDCFHLVLNCAFVFAGRKFLKLCEMAGINFEFDFDAMAKVIEKNFFNPETGSFILRSDRPELYSQLGNSFALLIGLGDSRTAEAIKNDKSLEETSLSMLTYKYDALLAADSGNRDYILGEIRSLYGYMLDKGATSFWETIKGEADFSGAGSLCHGWSALPIYYYHLFK